MGQLDGSVSAHRHAGRDAGEHGPLGGPDGGAGVLFIAVLFQIQLADQAQAGLAAGELALEQDHHILQLPQAFLCQVRLHGLVDLLDLLVHVVALQLALRQDQAQGGGGVAHIVVHPLPVFRLRGVLVAGHHGPLGQAAVLGQQDVGRGKGSFLHQIVLRFFKSVQTASSSAPVRRRHRQAPAGRRPRSTAAPGRCPSGCRRAGRGPDRRRVPGWRSGSCGPRG